MSESHFITPRLVLKKVLAKSLQQGNGAVLRVIPGEWESLDPFVTLFHFSVTAPEGFPDHPHRGFESVTYILQGALRYQDFAGHKSTVTTGDWVTAGRGIVHSEMPAEEGTHTGIQLWINLPSKLKMMEPRYKEVKRKEIPIVKKEGVEMRVLAGKAGAVESPYYSQTPVMMLDVTMKPTSEMHHTIPHCNCFVYVIEGEGVFGSVDCAPIEEHHVAVLGDGEGVSVWNKSKEKELRYLVIGGDAVKESVTVGATFVMNTQTQIQDTLEDFRHFKNGFELAKFWKSHY
ncbi:pirin-like protein [Senna tora]|uniref:Pirin-like protein n=1 Tax=Senna tora TaxID=362788 RepID=A0A834X2E0_9FABA|nr:pirin-like protein [Senna tora]